ncbi:MAG: DUF554 domain-containing protein [Clostridiaceae bacterium]|nr:DUF554 domain-containing protein [Clostridiaceae bacterium]MDD6273539.1 DUF554 domain-containing protein [Clostridiaceae bacterium]
MLGTIVNTAAILLGTLLGLLLKKGLPERFQDVIMKGLALCVLLIGISGALKGENTLIAILSIAIGAIIGEIIDLDRRLNNLGQLLEARFSKGDGEQTVARAFVTSSLLFCVGAMAIVGSLQSGLTGDHEMIYTKSMLDGISSIIFASSLGYGVVFSAVAVFVYQGAIVLLAQWIAPFLSDAVIAEMTCTGSLLIIALSLNMLGLTRIKVANYLPALLLPILLCLFL